MNKKIEEGLISPEFRKVLRLFIISLIWSFLAIALNGFTDFPLCVWAFLLTGWCICLVIRCSGS